MDKWSVAMFFRAPISLHMLTKAGLERLYLCIIKQLHHVITDQNRNRYPGIQRESLEYSHQSGGLPGMESVYRFQQRLH